MFLGVCDVRRLMIGDGRFGNGIVATRIAGMAAEDAACRKEKAFCGTVQLYGFYGIR